MRISDWSSDVCSPDLYTQATTFASPLAAANADLDTKVDVLRLAMLQAALAEFPATGHVLNPIDWAEIELTKITEDRKSVVEGKRVSVRVDLGGRSNINKKKQKQPPHTKIINAHQT